MINELTKSDKNSIFNSYVIEKMILNLTVKNEQELKISIAL
jgi:hypothetical protein